MILQHIQPYHDIIDLNSEDLESGFPLLHDKVAQQVGCRISGHCDDLVTEVGQFSYFFPTVGDKLPAKVRICQIVHQHLALVFQPFRTYEIGESRLHASASHCGVAVHLRIEPAESDIYFSRIVQQTVLQQICGKTVHCRHHSYFVGFLISHLLCLFP